MTAGILATKVGMTSVIDENGTFVPVTVVKAGPCVVLQVKTQQRDGYDALQLGMDDVKPHRSTMPTIGHCAKAGTGPKRYIGEVRLDAPADVEPGAVVTVESFAEGEIKFVDVSGHTRGKGFAGVMKRHNFGGKESSHGVERKHRSAGSIGGHSNLGRGRGVKKGKRMAGQMGNVRRTMQSLELVRVDKDNDLLILHGSVPGPPGVLLFVRQSKKRS